MKFLDKIFKFLDSKKNMKVLRSIGWILSLISIIFIINEFNKNKINFDDVKLSSIFSSLLLMSTSYICFGLAWSKFLKKNLGLVTKNSFFYWSYSNLGKYVPGFVGIPLLRISQDNKIKSKDLFFGIIEEQITPILILIPTSILILNLNLINNLIFYFGVFLLLFVFFFGFMYKKFNLFSGNKSYMHSRIELILGFIFQLLSIYIVCLQLGINDPEIMTIYYTLSSSIALLIIGSPAGIGVREIILLQLTNNLANNESIFLILIALRAIYFLTDIFYGVVGMFFSFYEDRNN
tara:strand:+ start:660 stop:1535 length:876 start_codon:yes stop_codon:yes gene_type:complete